MGIQCCVRISPTSLSSNQGDRQCNLASSTKCSDRFTGTNIDWNTLYKETLEQCALADKMGFDNLWFVEHHFLTGFSGSPCPEVMFGALSQITKRIRIGFGV